MKKVILTAFCMAVAGSLMAQDPVFTQYWSNPMYLNPALTGTNGTRLTLNHRNHFPSKTDNFRIVSASFDFKPCSFDNTGLGVMAMKNVEGAGFLTTTAVYLGYSYLIEEPGKFQLSFGLQPSVVSKSVNMENLVFGDQLDPSLGNIFPTAVELAENPSVTFFDVNAGASLRFFTPLRGTEDLYSNLGISFNHILQPNEAFIGAESRLPMRVSIHGGSMVPVYGIKARNPVYIVPNTRVELQSSIDGSPFLSQLDAGLYIMKSPLVAGLNTRTNLSSNRKNGKALGFMFGFKGVIENSFNYMLTYNYDVNVAGMERSNMGAHELSLNLNFDGLCVLGGKKNRYGRVNKCFDYEKKGIVPIF